jgi:hypothetical protein
VDAVGVSVGLDLASAARLLAHLAPNGPVKLQRFRDQAAWQHEGAVIRVGRERPAS